MNNDFLIFDKDFWIFLVNTLCVVVWAALTAAFMVFLIGVFKQDSKILNDHTPCHNEELMDGSLILICAK